MRKFYTLLISLMMISAASSYSQYGNFQMDNGTIRGVYSSQVNFEESVILKPPVPGIAKKVYVYLSGSTAQKDTVWLVGDPTDGSIPPTLWCRYINSYGGFIIDYKGTPGWFELDISNIMPQSGFDGLRIGGLNALVVQHTIKPGGPYFNIDNQTQTPTNANSFLNDVYKPNPNFNNIAGTIISYTEGRYMVRLQMEYEYLDSEGKPGTQPPPTLVDETVAKGLVAAGQPVVFEMASATDWNNDGFDDISIASNYFQNKGDGTFEDITTKVNIQNYGSVWADVDNDGFKDFYTARGGAADRIYFGKSDGTYEESTNNNFAIDAPTVSPLFLDYDADGLLDLFIAYGRRESGGNETYYPDKLYKNMGSRTFKDVTAESGIALGEPSPFYDTWGATTCDYNSDGKPDIFVATYRLAPDLLYRNNGDGTFTEVGKSTGVRGAATYYDNYFGHGMGSDWGMLTDDNDPDLVVGNLGHPDSRALASNPSLVWANNTKGSIFTDVTRQVSLGFYEMNAGVVLADLNNDGKNDIAHAQYAYYKKNAGLDKFAIIYLHEESQGLSPFWLKDITWESGLRIHGAWSPVRGDFDNDGGVDLLIASSNENAKLFNNKLSRGNWITFKLKGDGQKVNRDAFGSSVTIFTGDGKKRISQLPGTMLNARASQSSNDIHFGLGYNSYFLDSAIIRFQDGKVVNTGKLYAGNKYIVNYDGSVSSVMPIKPILVEPANDTVCYLGDKPFVFSWLMPGNETSYTIEIFDSNNLGIVILAFEGNRDSFTTATGFGTLDKPGVYHWKVTVKYADGSSAVSDVWTFEIQSSASKVNLISPANNAIDVDLGIVLYWNEIIGKKAVNVQIAKSSDFPAGSFASRTLSPTNMITSFETSEYVNEYNTKYFWRVRVADDMDVDGNADWGTWSETFNFTTVQDVSVDGDNAVARFGFTGVYPNPVNAATTFEFELPYFANLSLVIFDMSGKKVADVTEAYFEPGVHSIGFDASNLPAGTYQVRITDGVHINSRSFSIVR